MNFYEVGVRSSKYHGKMPLTYSSEMEIEIGAIITVPLRSESSLGVIIRKVKEPKNIRTKNVGDVFHGIKLPKPSLELISWIKQYYPSQLSSIIQLFLPAKIHEIDNSDELTSPISKELLPMTPQQDSALRAINKSSSSTALIHGETGTGKTRVYLELARETLIRGQSVIVLTPEIGLSPQLVNTFSEQFPGRVQTMHSGMTRSTRDKVWATIAFSKKALLIVGPRSAIFSPVQNLGLIVVDEAHDNGYKQDQSPYYEVTRVAAKLAAIANIKCVYGTATPRLADYWHLNNNKVPIVRLDSPINVNVKKPKVSVIDIKKREHFTRSSVFSEDIIASIEANLNIGDQSLVFLNRRGTARLVSCASCGWHASCPQCDTPLTYHGDTFHLRCHVCGRKSDIATACPDCGSSDISYKKRGTKSLETELTRLFPGARIQRFDSDNKADEKLDKNYESIIKGKVDIIIGTQVLAKGLDIPNLTLVAIPQADSGTYLPDYTADEQTYQLLRQVIGRVGRTSKPSKVIVQTYHPDGSLLKNIISDDWDNFYQIQIAERKKYDFPPFTYLLQLTTERAQQKTAQSACESLKAKINAKMPKLVVLGPSPRFHEKVSGKYQWQVIVKSKNRQDLLDIIHDLPSGWRHNIDPSNLL